MRTGPVSRALERARRLLAGPGGWIESAGEAYALRAGPDRRSRVVLTVDETVFRRLVETPGLRARRGGGWVARRAEAASAASAAGRPGVIEGVRTIMEADGEASTRRANLAQTPVAWLARRVGPDERPWLEPVEGRRRSPGARGRGGAAGALGDDAVGRPAPDRSRGRIASRLRAGRARPRRRGGRRGGPVGLRTRSRHGRADLRARHSPAGRGAGAGTSAPDRQDAAPPGPADPGAALSSGLSDGTAATARYSLVTSAGRPVLPRVVVVGSAPRRARFCLNGAADGRSSGSSS